MIDPTKLAIRDLSEADIPMILKYWFECDPSYIIAMGVDPAKMPTREVFEKALRDKVRANATAEGPKINAVIITLEGRPIGFHTINPLMVGDYGVFHAHILDTSLRRQGLAQHTYRMATKLFMHRFNLNRIIFKTPVQNIGANRVKEKIGIRCLGEEVVQNFNILKDGTRVKVYELTRAEADQF